MEAEEYNLQIKDNQPNQVVFTVNNTEYIRVSEDGFWVRGEKVKQDMREAEQVYEAFRYWLSYGLLSQDNK